MDFPLHALPMTDLQIVLRQLQQEILAALTESSPTPAGVRLEAESARLTLQLETEPQSNPAEPDPPRLRLARADRSPSGGGHSITVEFRIRGPERVGSLEPGKPAALPVPANGTPVLSDDDIAATCERIFGTPGFDNSARAEVFSEWASGLEDGVLMHLADSLARGEKPTPQTPEAARLTRLRRLLEFAPGGPVAAAQVLGDLVRTLTPDRVLRVLAERWHFGTHWVLPDQDSGR